MKRHPLVSINIRTYNSAGTLEETLESINKQTYSNREVLIADGYSIDDTVGIARKHKTMIHFASKLGEARQKNYLRSRGIYVFSIDSDQILDKDLVRRCVDMCEQGYDAVTVSEQSIISKGTFVEKVIAYDKWLIDKTRATDPVFGTACPRFFRKSLLETINWLDVLSIFDDTILYSHLIKQGAKVGYLRSSSIRHYEVTSFREVFSKFYRYGQGYIEALKQDPAMIAMHSLPRASYFQIEALSKPHYLVGLLLLYTVKAFGASLGVLSTIVNKL